MDNESLFKLLRMVKDNEISIEEGLYQLKSLPYEDLGFAKVDYHRQLRQGFPEVIFCQGKTTEQIVEIVKKLAQNCNGNVLGTRAGVDVYNAVAEQIPNAEYYSLCRLFVVRQGKQERRGNIVVLSAGTSDLPVAEEAAITAELMGNYVERIYDTGVSGIHRLLDQQDKLFKARVIIVVAGMEGALASVVGGLVDKPVIAVPTSVGYGATFGGLAALLSMLSSCASGVSVVNIDNGFGAGYQASLINSLGEGKI